MMTIPVSKDLRGLMEVAREQNWTVIRPEDNKLRWIPAKGEIVETTVTESILNIKALLIMGGLNLEPTHPKVVFEQKPPPQEKPKEEPPPPPAPPVVPPTTVEPKVEEKVEMPRKKRTPAGMNTAIVMEYVTANKDSVIATQEVIKGTGIGQSQVNRALSQMEQMGTLMKVSKGKYEWNDGKEKKEVAKVSKKITTAELDIATAMSNVISAVSALEQAVNAVAERLSRMEEVKKLLGE